MNQRILVCLGGLGDIINLLPICFDESLQGRRIGLMVADKFAGVLGGCSYVDAIPFKGEPWELDRAMKEAQQLSSDVACAQVAGPPDAIQRHGFKQATTESFQKEAWRCAGKLDLWRKQPPLIFDRRNVSREAMVLDRLAVLRQQGIVGTHTRKARFRRLILVATEGKTSPFPGKETLFNILKTRFTLNAMDVIDISQIKAEQFFDLLAVYEKAYCLVASDSAPLHLAYACPKLPVIAIVNDKPQLWNGSVWRPNHICHIRYSDFGERAWDMVRAIEGLGGYGCRFSSSLKPGPKMVHIWNKAELNEESKDRHEDAAGMWHLAYKTNHWVSCPIEVGATGRDTNSVFRDHRRFPYLKDAIRLATLRAEDDDVIVLTRCDTQFRMERITAPCYGRRWLIDPDTYHPAIDLFAFTKAWWREHQKDCPDLVLGMDVYWPRLLMEVMKEGGATEMPRGSVYRTHSGKVPASAPTQRAAHNAELLSEWLLKTNTIFTVPPVEKQLPMLPMNRALLFPFGYNPSIIRHEGKLLMSYRWHSENTTSTMLAMAEIDEAGGIVSNRKISIPQQPPFSSNEDPRLFEFRGRLHISYVCANHADMKTVVRYGRLQNVGDEWAVTEAFQPQFERNDGSAMEKNWVYFEQDGKLFCIYESTPTQRVLQVERDKVVAVHESPGVRWPWGAIRGGTAPLLHEGLLLRFFHSTLNYDPPPHRWRYYAGSLLMEPRPPFKVVNISKSPILSGSEADELSATQRSGCFHHKQKIVFPAGAVKEGDGWLLSVGVNDSAATIAKLTKEHLKL